MGDVASNIWQAFDGGRNMLMAEIQKRSGHYNAIEHERRLFGPLLVGPATHCSPRHMTPSD